VTLKDMLSKALEMDVSFHRGPRFWGTWRDAPFLGSLREGMFILGDFYKEFERYVKKRPCKWAVLNIEAL